MSVGANEFVWFYIGHYGQLGPLSQDQLEDLIQDGVIERETFVWRNGQPDWVKAGTVPEFELLFLRHQSVPPPPPGPSYSSPPPQARATRDYSPPPMFQSFDPMPNYVPAGTGYSSLALPVSDRNKVLAGVLQLILPGVGRMYLGFVVQGIIQLLLSACFFLGWIWSVVDGILILTGGVRLDGYGRRLVD